KSLIEARALVDKELPDGTTALMFAADKGFVSVVKILIDNGADINKERLDKATALALAIEHGHTDVVKALIDAGVVVDKESPTGTTALMLAAIKGHIALVKVLIDHGADVNKERLDKVTALIFAADKGHIDVVKALIDAGAIVDKELPGGSTALTLAASNRHRATADLLLKAGELSIEKVNNLITLATTDLPSRKKALTWAKGVFSYYVQFKGAEDLLFQEAMKTILWLEGNQNDACYIHACIRQKKMEYPDPMQAIRPIQIRECGAVVTLNAQGLTEGLHKAPTFQELKARIENFNQTVKSKPPLEASIFTNLFTSLLTHLATELKKDPSNERLIKKEREAKASAEPFIRRGQRIFELMKEPLGSDDAYAPLLVEKLYSIAEILLRKKDAVEGSDLLTPREDLMMAWLPLITNCATGQEEGVSLCYHYLNVSQTDEIDEDTIITEVKAKEGELYITTIVQAAMESVVTSPKTFEQFQVDASSLDQQVHLTKYLKNMTGLKSGMSCEEIIDEQGGWVPQEIRARSQEEILEVFFREVSKTLVSTLKDSFNSLELTLRKKTFSKLHEFAFQHKIDEETVWDTSEENPKLTELGALVLLEKAGYLQAEYEDYKEYLELKNKLVEVKELKKHLARERRIPNNRENIRKAEDAFINAQKNIPEIEAMQIQLAKMEQRLEEKSKLADAPLPIPSRKELLDTGRLPLDIRTLGYEIDEKRQFLSREQARSSLDEESIQKLEDEVALLEETYEKACNTIQFV
ncbi:MAG: ankyrin repeat domain-containing protein, partial [Chlamydiota bacterium]